MTTPLPDRDYPSRGWIATFMCEHPSKKLELAGFFPPENPDHSVFKCRCNLCGSQWDHTSDGVPWDQLLIKIAVGAFTSMTDPELRDKLQDRRQEIAADVDSDAAPITIPGEYHVR